MNEGDTFGTASGGANQPQFSNSFDRPSGAITSSPEEGVPTVSTAGSSNSSKFFGGRSRFSGRSSGGSSQANFAAAQQISSNPNTPQFFSEAVLANNPAPVENESKPKKGLFIGIGAALVVVLIVVVIAIVAPKGGGDNDPTTIKVADVVKEISRDDALDAIDLEKRILLIIQRGMKDDAFFDKNYYNTMVQDYEKYEKVANYFKGHKKIEGKDEQERNTKVESVALKMEKALPVYKEIIEKYKIIYSAKNDTSKLNGLNDKTSKESAKQYIETYNEFEKTMKYFDDNCAGVHTDYCDTVRNKIEELEDDIGMNGQRAYVIIIGDTNVDEISNNKISDELLDVMAYIGEKQLELEEKKDEK